MFAAGQAANFYSTNPMIISVNNIGVNGVIPDGGFPNSATLVSAFGEGQFGFPHGMVGGTNKINNTLHGKEVKFHM